MSQYPQKPVQPYTSPAYGHAPPKENSTAIVGLILSILGFVTCPIFSIVGMFVSWSAMSREPKGVAIAGFIIGLIGTIGVLIGGIVLICVFAGIFTLGAAAVAAAQQAVQELPQKQAVMEIVREYEGEGIPTQAEGEKIIQNKMDAWQNQLRYETDGSSFSVISDGPDGKPNTADDKRCGAFSSIEEARNEVEPFGHLEEDFEFDDMEEFDPSDLEETESSD